MKSTLLFIWLSCLSVMPIVAQDTQLGYRPFAQDEKVWETQVGWIMENSYCNFINGDTLINGKTWKKVYNYVAFPDFGSTYYAAIRDEGKKVYAIAKGSTKQRLLYDFSLKKDFIVRCGVEGNAFGCLLEKDEKLDTLLGFPFKSYLRVDKIDTINVEGQEFRRFTLTLLDAYQEYYRTGEESFINIVVWVEGFGSGAGPFSPWMPLPPRESIFTSCYVGKTYLFGNYFLYNADISVSVNRISSETNHDNMIIDLTGRSLNTIPEKGMYIQGRKKWLRK